MKVSTDLEKLMSFRDRGDLSHEEFERAKELLLSGNNNQDSLNEKGNPDRFAKKKKELKTAFLCAVLLSITWLMSLGSAIINPSALHLVLVASWAVAATLSWVSYSRAKWKLEQAKKPPQATTI
jgi:hypothetical protein